VREEYRRPEDRRVARSSSSGRQTTNQALAAVIRDVRTDVEGGVLLSQAMARHPNAFDRGYVSMIEAGEAAGILGTVPQA
jgi:type IV pilus assembly protein PilC